MNFFKTFWAKISAGAVGIIGILLWVLNLKQKKLNVYEAKAKLAKTSEEVRDLEREIKQLKKNRDTTKEQLDDLDQALLQLKSTKKKLREDAKNRTTEEIENHWNN